MSDVDTPMAPACIPSSTRSFIRCSSAGEACRAESPITIWRTVVWPTVCATLSGVPAGLETPEVLAHRTPP
jgi:hypothetical protein